MFLGPDGKLYSKTKAPGRFIFFIFIYHNISRVQLCLCLCFSLTPSIIVHPSFKPSLRLSLNSPLLYYHQSILFMLFFLLCFSSIKSFVAHSMSCNRRNEREQFNNRLPFDSTQALTYTQTTTIRIVDLSFSRIDGFFFFVFSDQQRCHSIFLIGVCVCRCFVVKGRWFSIWDIVAAATGPGAPAPKWR